MMDVDTLVSREETVRTDRTPDRFPQESSVTGPPDLEELRARTLAAKLSLPHQGFVLRRPRLRALVEPARGGGVISLVAGPGYGKTAFIVDLLAPSEGRGSSGRYRPSGRDGPPRGHGAAARQGSAVTDSRSVYYAVDEGDRDPVRLLTHLMAGLRVEPPEAAQGPALDWTEGGGSEAAVLGLAAALVDAMSSQTDRPTLLAIDDFHIVDSSPLVLRALELVVRSLPPSWTIILASRRRAPLHLDGVTLGGRLVRLQGRDLRLTPREVAAWAQEIWAVHLQPSEARALWRLTEGWPAALVLLGQHLLSNAPGIVRRDVMSLVASGRDLRTYLENEILSDLEPYAAEVVLCASLLPRVAFPRDQAYLPGSPGEAEAVLEDFVSRGFLVARVGRRSYTLHPLLRGFAEREVWRRSGDSGSEPSLIMRAAEHLEGVGEHHQAASLYLRAGHGDAAARCLRTLATSSLNATVNFARGEWLQLIPSAGPAGGRLDPWLLVARARILQQDREYSRAVVDYEQAARLLSATGESAGLLPVLLGLAFCLFNQGRWDESLAVMKRCRVVASSRDEKVEVLVAEGNVLVSLCRWDEAVEDWEQALALAPGSDKEALTRRIEFQRARLFYSLGHYRLATEWIDKALSHDGGPPASTPGSGSRISTPTQAMALNGAAILAYLTGDYQRAERLVGECLRLIETRGFTFIEISTLLNQASVALGRWDYRVAVAKIRMAQGLAAKAGDAEESCWAEDMFGDLCRRNGNATRALEHHRRALEIVAENRLAVFEQARALGAVGMDLVVLGREDEARISLEETVRMSRRWGLKSSLAPALFYLGWLDARKGRESDAVRCLSEAMRIASEHGHVHFFRQEARVAVPILALCQRFEVGAFVRENVLPALPARLADYYHRLAERGTYPTDVSLGPPQRLREETRAWAATEEMDASALEGMESLTEREREVLKMIALGMPNKVIGAKLYITEKTVKTHANHIFRKLGVSSRLQATLAFQSYQRARRTAARSRPKK